MERQAIILSDLRVEGEGATAQAHGTVQVPIYCASLLSVWAARWCFSPSVPRSMRGPWRGQAENEWCGSLSLNSPRPRAFPPRLTCAALEPPALRGLSSSPVSRSRAARLPPASVWTSNQRLRPRGMFRQLGMSGTSCQCWAHAGHRCGKRGKDLALCPPARYCTALNRDYVRKYPAIWKYHVTYVSHLR